MGTRTCSGRCCTQYQLFNWFGCFFYFLFFIFYFVVPMGIFPVGNLGHFPRGKPSATESCYLLCDDITRYEALYSSMTGGYRIFNNNIFDWAHAIYTGRGVRYKQVCIRLDSEGQTNCSSPCPARGSNHGSWDLISDALSHGDTPPVKDVSQSVWM